MLRCAELFDNVWFVHFYDRKNNVKQLWQLRLLCHDGDIKYCLPLVGMSWASFLGTNVLTFFVYQVDMRTDGRHDTIQFQDCVHLLRVLECLSVWLLEHWAVLCDVNVYARIFFKSREVLMLHVGCSSTFPERRICWSFDCTSSPSVTTTQLSSLMTSWSPVRHLWCILCMSFKRFDELHF